MEKLYTVPLKKNRMYLRGSYEAKEGRVVLSRGSSVSADTYFGCFHCAPWLEHTTVRNIRACVKLRGSGRAELRCLALRKGKLTDTVISAKEFGRSAATENCKRPPEAEVLCFTADLTGQTDGCFYIRVAAEQSAEIFAVWYEGDGAVRSTKIAVVICTFRREEYVLRNLKIISAAASADPFLKDSLELFCVDNGGTLKEVPPGVRLIRNRNYGGSGGYARGMLEALRPAEKDSDHTGARPTHFWLMDDDIRFDPSVLHRAVSMMRHRKQEDLQLAAGMFSFEEPSVQWEASAAFNGYTFVSNGRGLDFRNREDLLKNRIRKGAETGAHLYGAWWSLVMPAGESLPMPFFIKLDDVEYGLRTKGSFAVLNGFGVWHEAFGKKGNAWNEYYTTRNTLIIQSLYPDLPRNRWKMMGVRLLKALAYNEPKCMEAALQGVKDYAAGPASFEKTDPEVRHSEVMERFRAPLSGGMSRKKMLYSAAVNLFRPESLRSVHCFLLALKMLRKCGPDRQRSGWKRMGTGEFWEAYLGLSRETAQAEEKRCRAAVNELISVIIPVYNVAPYLDQCLESVCAQTYRNLEILLIDDGSTDDSGAICDMWAEKDARIRVIHKENGGVSSARNEGLKAASGSLIGFVDSDDWVEPVMYEKLADRLMESGADAAVCGYMDYPYGEGVPVPKGTKVLPPCDFADSVIALFERGGYFTTLWNKLFRRESIMENGSIVPLDTTLDFGEDEVWLVTVLRKCEKVVFLPEPLYHWRPRSGSVTRFRTISEKQLSLLRAKRIALEKLPKRRDVIELAKSRTFNDCFYMKVQAYCAKDWRSFRIVSDALVPMKRSWFFSPDPPLLRKIKVILMEAMMRMHMPVKLIGVLSGITQYSFKKTRLRQWISINTISLL